VIGRGEPVPDVTIWIDRDSEVATRELAGSGPFLLLFYLFDWTGT
jgi:hypothetical protein